MSFRWPSWMVLNPLRYCREKLDLNLLSYHLHTRWLECMLIFRFFILFYLSCHILVFLFLWKPLQFLSFSSLLNWKPCFSNNVWDTHGKQRVSSIEISTNEQKFTWPPESFLPDSSCRHWLKILHELKWFSLMKTFIQKVIQIITLLFKSAFTFILQSWVINFNTIAGGQHKRMNRFSISQHRNVMPTTMDYTTCNVLYYLMVCGNLMIWNRQGQKYEA